MKFLIILLSLLLLCHAVTSSDDHERVLHPGSKAGKGSKHGKRPNYRPSKRDDDDNYNGGLMCLDLGSRGKHTLRVSAKLRALTELRWAKKGECDEDTKLKWNIRHYESYCAEFNHQMVTIRAPEGLRRWMVDVVKAEGGACRYRDDIIVIREV